MNSEPENEPGMWAKAPVILVVEDDSFTRKMVGRRLHAAGYEVILVANAGDALKIAQTESFQVLVLDLNLVNTDPFGGIQDGLAAVDWLRQQIGDFRFRIVVHTSQAEQRLIQKAEALGVFAYCIKRRDMNNLVECVGEAVASLKAA